MNIHFTLVNILFLITINALKSKDIVFLIISQPHPYNIELASRVEENIKTQSDYSARIFLSDRDFPYRGDWTIFPLIPSILNRVDHFKWLFICTERTHVNIEKLLKTLKNYNEEEEIYLGHALHDREATIIHHFAFSENPGNFTYPNAASGFVLSYPLIAKISKRYETSEHVDFSIDASHELAMFIWNNGAGVTFIDDPSFCVTFGRNHCATAVYPFKQCTSPIPADEIYFAVKTCGKYHETRVDIVKKTWADFTRHIEYFSDEFNVNIPTIALQTPNTERGHCAKTMEILWRTAKMLQSNFRIRWVVVTDDDTIISPARLRQFLSCYSDGTDPVVIGERYGYRVRDTPSMGYNYITGGGGMVFNRRAVLQLFQKGNECKCPKADAPDDMTLGACFTNMPAFIVHSPYFHQARPADYAKDYLLPNDEAISFHKHWMIDPVQVYKEWFYPADRKLFVAPDNIKVEL